MKVLYTDVLVIGGGLAGLRAAIAARRRGHDAIILSLVPAKRSHSKAAQGGMQASLGAPESIEGFMAFKQRRSPAWVHPDLRLDGRL